mmetsp:Transcript_9019/g.21420  ORF Transcript_9019/g.21420 Transcript_9019/m.21420 type:complete len:581 (-) Transcript_9019:3044-4786(-)
MLSLSRCPSKKRKKKKDSSSSSSSLLTVATKSSIASVNHLDDDDDHDDISLSPPRSSSERIRQEFKKIEVEALKENQEQQVQKLKRHRERKRKRQMRMESALESILKPPVQHSDSSELKRMEKRFWNDDDSDFDEIEKQNSDPPFAEPSCHASTKSQNTTSERIAKPAAKLSKPPVPSFSLGNNGDGSESDNDPLFEEAPMTSKKGAERTKSKLVQQGRPPIPSFSITHNVEWTEPRSNAEVEGARNPPATASSNNGTEKRKNDIAQGSHNNLEVPVSASNQEGNNRAKDTKLPQVRKMLDTEARSTGEDIISHNTVRNTSVGQSCPSIQLKDWAPSSKTKGKEKISLEDEPDSGDDQLLLYLQANGERTTGVQFGHNSTIPNIDYDPHVPDTKHHGLDKNENEVPKGKTTVSNQSSHYVKNQAPSLASGKSGPSRADASDKVTTSIPKPDRDAEAQVVPPSLCETLDVQPQAILEIEHDLKPHKDRSKNGPLQLKLTDKAKLESRATETSASDTEPRASSTTLHIGQAEPIVVENHATSSGSNKPQKNKVKSKQVSSDSHPINIQECQNCSQARKRCIK